MRPLPGKPSVDAVADAVKDALSKGKGLDITIHQLGQQTGIPFTEITDIIEHMQHMRRLIYHDDYIAIDDQLFPIKGKNEDERV